MCGRFRIDCSVDEISRIVDAIEREGSAVKTGELRPTDCAPVLVWENNAAAAKSMSWGFPRQDGRGVVFNARAESALEKALFREALQEHPLIIPCGGFYEWASPKKTQYLFQDAGWPVLYMAGCFRRFSGRDCFTLLTTVANADMARYHHRMPVLIRRDELEAWLRGANRNHVLSREPFALVAEPVQSTGTGIFHVQGTLL